MDPITDTQKFTFGVQPLDKKGQPTTVPAGAQTPNWASSNPLVADVKLNTDGVSGDVVAGIPGTATISFEQTLADGTAIAGTGDVTVISGAEATVKLTPGPVSEQ